MKILLHSDKMKEVEKSGVGRAIVHQQEALKLNHVEYTLNPKVFILISELNKSNSSSKSAPIKSSFSKILFALMCALFTSASSVKK